MAKGIQQELIEDARQTKTLPAKLRNKLGPLCEAEETAGSSRLRANELLDEIKAMMGDLELTQVALPNGGKVVYTEKTKARYVAPKKSPIEDEDDEGAEKKPKKVKDKKSPAKILGPDAV